MAAAARQLSSRRGRDTGLDDFAGLSDLDAHVLEVVSEHRVVTQTQLELLVGVPGRTLRYRTARLFALGLVGRTRPYRDRGSAPFHLWPTRRGDALVRGAPVPRGGERREPNPTFIAHAAALTGFYVALAKTLPRRAELASFAREGEAREPFRSRDGRARAIAPDARVELDQEGRRLVAFLEVDLGTMSHRRLRAKARGYADYAGATGWVERHEFRPGLLFATIAARRAAAFLEALAAELESDADLFAAACGFVHEPARAVVEPVWLMTSREERLDLVAALGEARRPYDEEQARREHERRREREQRKRLLGDPVTLRDHLCRQRRGLPARLDGPERIAVELLLEGEGELAEPERHALRTLGGLLADPLLGLWAERELQPGERGHLARLAEDYRSRQLDHLLRLQEDSGVGPALRHARWRLEAGDLMPATDLRWLAIDAERDRQAQSTQERLRDAYLEHRDQEARRLAKSQGLAGRLRHGPEEFLGALDRRLLRICPRCEEVAYPGTDDGASSAWRNEPAKSCHFCGQGGLVAFEEAHD